MRTRQGPDGLWYPGPPPNKAEALTSAAKTKAEKTSEKDSAKETEAAISLTLRVLVVLRRIN